ncbi:MAG: ATP synthase F1 subunit gamma [Chloroflexi bacterium]|nr:ATP synthase F1 subunit gamma [Chloroflexota bacterium]|tara:strand:+ start:1604 stop:2449 length:846 start_codon:yes stop_codon:yes gene_type:complete
MPNLRELRSRIRSIESTSRVTKALQMIAAAKMKKAQDKVLDGRAYSEKLNSIISNVYKSNPEVFLTNSNDVKNLILLVTPDRGLCGALVSNILKEASKFIESIKDDYYEIRVIGKKGTSFVSKLGNEYESFKVSDMPTFDEVSPITGNISNDINLNGFSKVFILYTEFISTAVQKPKIKQLLPIELELNDLDKVKNEFLYEPNLHEVSKALIPRYVETSIYNSILDSIASEHSARLVAMQNATDNANELKEDLTLDLNKARQQQVTSEILDIIGGALALEE